MLVAQGCIIVVVLASFAGIFIHSAAIGLTAGAALAVFLVLCWRQFTIATWLTVSLCVLLLAAAMLRGIAACRATACRCSRISRPRSRPWRNGPEPTARPN